MPLFCTHSRMDSTMGTHGTVKYNVITVAMRMSMVSVMHVEFRVEKHGHLVMTR